MGLKRFQYRGELSAADIADGMNAAITNARRLIKDAELLFEARRFPSATALAILAIEEEGKLQVLRGLAVAKTPADRAEAWSAYRSHAKKNVLWPFRQAVASGARHLDEFRHLLDGTSNHPDEAETVKQMAFYSDCVDDRRWIMPTDHVDVHLARHMLDAARALQSKRQVSMREVELWQEHLGPVWRTSEQAMRDALLRYATALEAEGLQTPGHAEGFAVFLATPNTNERS